MKRDQALKASFSLKAIEIIVQFEPKQIKYAIIGAAVTSGAIYALFAGLWFARFDSVIKMQGRAENGGYDGDSIVYDIG